MGSWRGLKHVHFSVEFSYVNSSCILVQSTSTLVIFILRRSDWARRISESSTTDNQSVGFVTAVWKGNVKRRKFTVVHKWREFWRVFDHILFRFAYGYINLSCISDRSRETLSHLLSNLRKPSVAGKFFQNVSHIRSRVHILRWRKRFTKTFRLKTKHVHRSSYAMQILCNANFKVITFNWLR